MSWPWPYRSQGPEHSLLSGLFSRTLSSLPGLWPPMLTATCLQIQCCHLSRRPGDVSPGSESFCQAFNNTSLPFLSSLQPAETRTLRGYSRLFPVSCLINQYPNLEPSAHSFNPKLAPLPPATVPLPFGEHRLSRKRSGWLVQRLFIFVPHWLLVQPPNLSSSLSDTQSCWFCPQALGSSLWLCHFQLCCHPCQLLFFFLQGYHWELVQALQIYCP